MQAIQALKNIIRLNQARLAAIYGDPDDGDFADAGTIAQFAGDYVMTERGGKRKKFLLLKELGKGGEGTVYKTELEGFVVKIYKPEKLTRLRHEKLKFMLTKNIDCEGVCFPSAMIYNLNNEFVGYLMRAPI